MGSGKQQFHIHMDDEDSFKHDTNFSESEFKYSYGLGIRIFLFRYLSLLAEYRWIPGHATGPAYPISSNVSIYYEGDVEVPNKSKLFSLGLVFTFWPKN